MYCPVCCTVYYVLTTTETSNAEECVKKAIEQEEEKKRSQAKVISVTFASPLTASVLWGSSECWILSLFYAKAVSATDHHHTFTLWVDLKLSWRKILTSSALTNGLLWSRVSKCERPHLGTPYLSYLEALWDSKLPPLIGIKTNNGHWQRQGVIKHQSHSSTYCHKDKKESTPFLSNFKYVTRYR